MIPTLIRAWFWLHLASLAAIALQPSTQGVVLGRYSTTAALALVVFVVLTPVVWFGTRWLAGRVERVALSRRAYAAALLAASGALFGLWALPASPTSSHIVIRLYLTFVLFTAALWSLERVRLPSWTRHLPWALGLGSCLALLALATRFPGLFWTDEGFMVSGALGTTQVGYPKVLYFQPFEMEAYSLTYFGLGAWFTAFGVDIWVGRVYIFALGLASLALVYAAARIAYSRFAAWVAVILGAYALSATNVLRADIGAAFWLAVALLGFVLAVWRGRPWLHLVVGYALGLALDGHPNAYRFGLAFALAYALDYGLLLRERRRFFVYWPLVYLAVGGALGFLTYFLIFATVTHRFLDYAGDPFFGADLAALPGVLLEQLTSALRLTPLLLGAGLAGVVAALWRRRTLWRPRGKRRALDRLLLVALAVSALALASLYGYYRDYYLVQSIPLLALAAAGFMHAVETRLPARAPGALALVVALTCAGLLVAQVRAAGSQSYNAALDVADRLRAIVPDDAAFVGPDPLYHRMHDYGGFTEMNTGVLYAGQAGIEEAQAWEAIAPAAVAVVRGYPIPPPPALLGYIARHDFTRVRCWSTRQLGEVELYMRTIPDGVTPSGACEDLP